MRAAARVARTSWEDPMSGYDQGPGWPGGEEQPRPWPGERPNPWPDEPVAPPPGGAGYPGGYPPPPPNTWQQPGWQQPGWQQPGPALEGAIRTYRTQAIVLIVASVLFGLFGLIGAIPAMVYASQVTQRLGIGDTAGAMAASRRARTWCWVGLGILVLTWIVLIALLASGGHVRTNTG
ncbi:MAG TPA: CD225/dispanin family protein, partial [Acidimicrobiales bacterium]|nr:CD225/dispanin family protein [Acidimicrobiales bacterium]